MRRFLLHLSAWLVAFALDSCDAAPAAALRHHRCVPRPACAVESVAVVAPQERPAQAAGSVMRWVPARQAPAPVAPGAQQPAMRPQRVLVERGNVVCAT